MNSRSSARIGPRIKTGVKNVDIAGAFKVRRIQTPSEAKMPHRVSKTSNNFVCHRSCVTPPSTTTHKPGQLDWTGLKTSCTIVVDSSLSTCVSRHELPHKISQSLPHHRHSITCLSLEKSHHMPPERSASAAGTCLRRRSRTVRTSSWMSLMTSRLRSRP